jgi:UPF0755 protein
MRWLRRLFVFLLLTTLMAAGLAAGASWWWLNRPLPLATGTVEVSIEPGLTPRRVAELWVEAGVQVPARWLFEAFRWTGQARHIRAGSYEIEAGITPRQLIDKMVRGDQLMETVRFVEGCTFAEMREVLAQAPALEPTTRAMSDAQVMAAVGEPALVPEGRFFPDTYAYTRGVSDLTVLKRAFATMQLRLISAWAERAADLPLKSMDEALILASIVEKETGRDADRTLVAGVFINRLRLGMPLQTDPTVIYGLGARFDGNLRRRDLLADTPFNTYTRQGLPPTPIAMPGAASLRATVQPAGTRALYFVARSDGSGASVFSESLAEHNRAVNTFQRGGKAAR